MPDFEAEDRSGFKIDTGTRRFQVTAYIGGLKIIGVVYFSADTRASSRRASDFIHSLTQELITLSTPRVYERSSGQVIDEPPFIVITRSRIDAVHAEELEDEEVEGP